MRTILSSIYRVIVQLRNRAYESGLLRTRRAPVPVISVGNITAGGSGKTPVVEHVLHQLIARDVKPAVLTRGYRRESKGLVVVSDGSGRYSDTRESGDEAMQIARKFPAVPVIACEKRNAGARHAIDHCGAEVLVLDDAFQHRAIARDLDIVVFDASEERDRHRMLPVGRLREPLGNLARADLIVLSRCDSAVDCDAVAQSVCAHTEAPAVRTAFAVHSLRMLESGERSDPNALEGRDVFAFCGIGTPAAFEHTLRSLGMNVRELVSFRDHHWYSIEDMQRLIRRSEELGVDALLTTEKDAVRIAEMIRDAGAPNLCYPELHMEFLEGEKTFIAALDAVLPSRS